MEMEDWQEQIKNSVNSIAELRDRGFKVEDVEKTFPMRITPHILSLMDKDTSTCVIAKEVVPSPFERINQPAEMEDPILEENDSIAGVLVHSYPNRALLFVSQCCAAYCRFCTRKRNVGTEIPYGDEDYQQAFNYLREHPEIEDVLLSGGDALMIPDDRLEFFLENLRRIESIKVIRIGTRVLYSLPQRITSKLVSILQKYQVLYINSHFNHPRQISTQTITAVNKLLQAGISLGNQTVLLKGINDDVDTMRKLCTTLFQIGIRPYYLYHCDLTQGDAYFRTTIERGKEIHRKLYGWISGLAVPTYIFDGPYIRKTPINKDYCTRQKDGTYLFRNYKGIEWVYDEAKALAPE